MKAMYRHLPHVFPEFVWEIDEYQATGTIGLLRVAVAVNPSLKDPPYRAWMPSRPSLVATGGTPGLAIGALLEVPSVKLAWDSERMHQIQQAEPRPVPPAPSLREQERTEAKWWIFDTIFGGIVAAMLFYWLWR